MELPNLPLALLQPLAMSLPAGVSVRLKMLFWVLKRVQISPNGLLPQVKDRGKLASMVRSLAWLKGPSCSTFVLREKYETR